DASRDTFEATVPAGVGRRFELEALRHGEGDPVPVYWGATTVDLVADSTTDLTITAYPVGELELMPLAYGDNAPANVNADVTIDTAGAIPGLHGEQHVTTLAGGRSRVLTRAGSVT